MAAGFAEVCWDESNISDSDTPSDEESQVLLSLYVRMLMKSMLRSSKNSATALSLANLCSLHNLCHSTKCFITQIDSGIGAFHPLRYLRGLPERELDCTIYHKRGAYKLKL